MALVSTHNMKIIIKHVSLKKLVAQKVTAGVIEIA